MAVILRDSELERKLEADRRARFGDSGGSLSRVLREMLREHYLRRELEGGKVKRTPCLKTGK